MLTVLTLNLIAVFILFALTFFFGGDDLEDRFFHALIVLIICLGASTAGWVIYVAAHFIGKYW